MSDSNSFKTTSDGETTVQIGNHKGIENAVLRP